VSALLDVLYLLAACIASPWIAYRLIARGDWRGLSARFGTGLGDQMTGSIWLHGSSAGEIALLVPLVRLLDESGVGDRLVISAYSATGIAAARRTFPNRRVIVFPFDLSSVVGRVFNRLDPRLIVIVESEFWPNFLRAARYRRIPVAVINGKISERSCRFYARTRFIPRLLRQLSLIALQTEGYEQRMRALGVDQQRMHVTGNMKYDLAYLPQDSGRARMLREQLGFRPNDAVVIGGSVHENEDAALISAFKELLVDHPQLGLVIVPRYPTDARRIEQLAAAAGFSAVRKTAIDLGKNPAPGRSSVIIVDTVGELRELYGIADIAFVGGSLFYRSSNKGGHNLMEPAVQGIPVVFGSYHYSFRDTARELIDAQAGFEASDENALTGILRRLLDDEALRHASGRRAVEVIRAGRGATRRNFELLLPIIDAAGLRLPGSELSPTMPPALGDRD
jgi:3-deoxy-D-manno-octulosonic-acid transferase